MRSEIALAAVAGIVLGVGLWVLVSGIRLRRDPRIIDRAAPYLQDVSPHAREITTRVRHDPLLILGLPSARLITAGAQGIRRLRGGDEQLTRALQAAGHTEVSPDTHRAQQSVLLAAGLLLGATATAVAFLSGELSPALIVMLGAVVAAAPIAIHAGLLRQRVRRRRRAMERELPTVLEFLSLSLSAGEGVRDAIDRVAGVGRGVLAAELGRVMDRVRTGVVLADSLAQFERSAATPAVSRFVDQLLGALQRGTPLADVLRAQAADARADGKRLLLEEAGRREIAMMIPLVFLILPLSVLFAIFPGLALLDLGFQ